MPIAVVAHVAGSGTALSPASLAVLAALVLAGAAYLRGARRSARQSGGREVALVAGLTMLGLAVAPPVDTFADDSLVIHMLQHLLLVSLAPPLLVLAEPVPRLLLGQPAWLRRALAGRWGSASRWAQRSTAVPIALTAVHITVFWAWHIPAAYEAALRSPSVHALEHATLALTALAWWWAVIEARRRGPSGYGLSLALVVAGAVHGAMLGLFMTFSARAWYPSYAVQEHPFGFSVLEDQQAAGALLWAGGGVIYVTIAVVLLARWIAASDRGTAVPTPAPAAARRRRPRPAAARR